jgi:hypothetical protein
MKKRLVAIILLAGAGAAAGIYSWPTTSNSKDRRKPLVYRPWQPLDTSGFLVSHMGLEPWKDPTNLEEIRRAYDRIGYRNIARLDNSLAAGVDREQEVQFRLFKAAFYLYEGEPKKSYEVLQELRAQVEGSPRLAQDWLYTVIFFQGVVGLRRGETENCIDCRGEGACIFPLRPSAVHTLPDGSRLAIAHFTEYLQQFPDDLGVRWLLNLAYMTLGEQASGVPEQFRLAFERCDSELDIGRFRDVAHSVGVNRLNMAGGAIMDDFDNDGLLDIVVSTWDAGMGMVFYRNKGDGTFEARSETAGLAGQYGGFNIVQTDYNNDGFLDIFVTRGGWMQHPMRNSLLRNNGDGTFTDVTREAGLLEAGNSMSAGWADFDNDGFLDLFVCCERVPNRLYRNKGNGTFEEVSGRAGLWGKQKTCKGAVWLDYDNDGWPDLLVTYLDSTPQLFHNNRDGSFTDVSEEMGITGPRSGFSCWAFDYDNDGWTDLFVTSYERSLTDLVRGILGQPTSKNLDVTRLYRNEGGKRFVNASKQTGVAGIYATMGSNFADFDNDGYLDFYLATGDPYLETLVPNRMFKNVSGRWFAEITTTSGTGHLQKGHGVACGDWDRDGNVDLFVETGGATPGDRFHNVLFQNPGQGNHWLTVKLIGQKTNRAAIGARIKVVTVGEKPLTVYRHVSSGSSFGANPLQQTIGLGKAGSIDRVEVWWPTSRTTQVFRDVAINQAIEVTEFAADYHRLNWTPIPIRGQ